jgi:ApbE superfamily uncharacterized protein (UPF0280 family)
MIESYENKESVNEVVIEVINEVLNEVVNESVNAGTADAATADDAATSDDAATAKVKRFYQELPEGFMNNILDFFQSDSDFD